MLTATGDLAIITGNGDRFPDKNATFTFPLTQDVQIEGWGQPINKVMSTTSISSARRNPCQGRVATGQGWAGHADPLDPRNDGAPVGLPGAARGGPSTS
jgi:hypothetical protein